VGTEPDWRQHSDDASAKVSTTPLDSNSNISGNCNMNTSIDRLKDFLTGSALVYGPEQPPLYPERRVNCPEHCQSQHEHTLS